MGITVTNSVAAVFMVLVVTARGGELAGGEGDPAEHLAGILRRGAGGVAALLGGQGVVKDGYDELGVPLQADDGELPQGHIQPPLGGAQHQILVKQPPDPLGDLDTAALLMLTGLRHPGGKNHGIQYLHCGHQIGGQHFEDYCLSISLIYSSVVHGVSHKCFDLRTD